MDEETRRRRQWVPEAFRPYRDGMAPGLMATYLATGSHVAAAVKLGMEAASLLAREVAAQHEFDRGVDAEGAEDAEE